MRPMHFNTILIVLLLCTSCAFFDSESESEASTAMSLPQECEMQIAELAQEYGFFGIEQGSCELATESPDHTVLAYVRLEEKTGYCSTNSLAGEEVVKIIRRDSPTPVEVYRTLLFHVGALEWMDDGRLLIWDAPLDLVDSPGITAIYDPQAGGLVRRLPFSLFEGVTFWNAQKTAFYTSIFIQKESRCTTNMGGYDFTRDRELPPFEPITPSQYVFTVDDPVWSKDGTQLLISVRSGTLIGDDPCLNGKIEWGPASIMMLDLSMEDLQPVLIKGDSENNYYLQIDSSGQYEILSEPYVPNSSTCCRCC